MAKADVLESVKEELSLLSKSRQYLRQRVSKLLSTVDTEYIQIDEGVRLRNIEKLTNFKNELDDLNRKIFPLYVKAGNSDKSIDENVSREESYDDQIVDCLTFLKNSGAPSVQPQSSESPGNKLKLPKVPLPQFNNPETDDLQKFL